MRFFSFILAALAFSNVASATEQYETKIVNGVRVTTRYLLVRANTDDVGTDVSNDVIKTVGKPTGSIAVTATAGTGTCNCGQKPNDMDGCDTDNNYNGSTANMQAVMLIDSNEVKPHRITTESYIMGTRVANGKKGVSTAWANTDRTGSTCVEGEAREVVTYYKIKTDFDY